ncbi:bifunctional diaminohydroxyphosphoribosylaminopyrimidine deaminase/5-amino-6-(5-phosphoribosylamino)uracil reductase RibD [soil metagenome]
MTTPPSEDETWMQLALDEAQYGVGLTSPNPPVGAVLVKDGILIGRGWHQQAGLPHAEIEALQDAQAQGQDVQGATVYVTLEPCSTEGSTGACTSALIAAGIVRVVYGARDPNPHHAGNADALLQEAGIEVTSGVLEEECNRIIRPFTKWITTGLPYIIAKVGQSLDGRLTRPLGESPWITSEESRLHSMYLRVRCDAIMIGAETLRQDDPNLTLRGPNIPSQKQQPWRVIVSRSGNLPANANLFTDEHQDRTLVVRGTKKFNAILQELAEKGITSVLIEGGGNLMGQAFAARVVDEICWYIAPRICGGGVNSVGNRNFSQNVPSVALKDTKYVRIGDNLCVTGYPDWTLEP